MPEDPRRLETERKNLGEVIKLVVGEEKRVFLVHKALLCEHSGFFQAATESHWKEGQDGVITLPDDDVDVLELYTHWVYWGLIYCRRPVGRGEERCDLRKLILAFIFGEKVQNGPFKDAIIDALIVSVSKPDENGVGWYPVGALVRIAYAGTPRGSPLRRLLVDMQIHHIEEKWISSARCLEFLVDLSRKMLPVYKSLGKSDPTHIDASSCSYHHHGSEQECYIREIHEF